MIAGAHDHSALFNPKEIKDGSTLTVVDCVANAFKNSPVIKRKKYKLDIAKSDVGIAKSSYFPVISVGAGFQNINNSNNKDYDNYYRELPNVGVSINKMVWDFGRTTSYIKMEEFYKLGAEYEFMDSLCWTLFDIKYRYYELLRAKALLQVAENNVDINKKFVENSKPGADMTTAKLNLSNAEVELVVAKNNFKNAKVDLSNSMYLPSQLNFSIQNTKTFDFDDFYSYEDASKVPVAHEQYKMPFNRSDAVELAYASSPDLRVLDSTKNAMNESLNYIKKTYFPAIYANAGYGFNNTNLTSSNSSLRVGVNVSSNVNLMELKHSIKGADAQLSMADNEILLFKQDLYYRLQRAFNNFDKFEHQMPVSQLQAKQSLENLKLVEAKYKSGELDYVALQEARKQYIKSVNAYVDCMYDYNIAIIEIERAMHYHIVDIHHRAEHAVNYHSDALLDHMNEALGCDKYNDKNISKNKKSKENHKHDDNL